jgi:hypothetical protein
MTSDDSKFKIIAVASIALLLLVMGVYESRKTDLIQHHVNTERLKLEKTLSEHEKAKQQMEILQRKNRDLEKSAVKSSERSTE